MLDDKSVNDVLEYFNNQNTQALLKQFQHQVIDHFELNAQLYKGPLPVIHSIKSRIKDPTHLEDKLYRKKEKGILVTTENLFKEITDLLGVRILYLYQDQFPVIHNHILKQIEQEYWEFVEAPKAYTWDPETEKFFNDLSIATEVRDTYYTSVHYVVKLRNKHSPICCEIQVRTLFEEIWGEIDHTINYPHKTECVACKEQLRVLSKLVSTGTRLSDSIFRSYKDYLDSKESS